jgi:hypothetical protein
VRRFAEGTPELAAEVRLGEMRGPRERGNIEGLAVARVDEVLGPKQVPGRRDRDDQRSTS